VQVIGHRGTRLNALHPLAFTGSMLAPASLYRLNPCSQCLPLQTQCWLSPYRINACFRLSLQAQCLFLLAFPGLILAPTCIYSPNACLYRPNACSRLRLNSCSPLPLQAQPLLLLVFTGSILAPACFYRLNNCFHLDRPNACSLGSQNDLVQIRFKHGTLKKRVGPGPVADSAETPESGQIHWPDSDIRHWRHQAIIKHNRGQHWPEPSTPEETRRPGLVADLAETPDIIHQASWHLSLNPLNMKIWRLNSWTVLRILNTKLLHYINKIQMSRYSKVIEIRVSNISNRNSAHLCVCVCVCLYMQGFVKVLHNVILLW